MLKISLLTILIATSTVVAPTSKAFAYTEQDVGRLATLAAIYGRAAACGVDSADAGASIERTAKWMASTFGSEHNTYMEIFKLIMQLNGQNQFTSKTGVSCDSVLESFAKLK